MEKSSLITVGFSFPRLTFNPLVKINPGAQNKALKLIILTYFSFRLSKKLQILVKVVTQTLATSAVQWLPILCITYFEECPIFDLCSSKLFSFLQLVYQSCKVIQSFNNWYISIKKVEKAGHQRSIF